MGDKLLVAGVIYVLAAVSAAFAKKNKVFMWFRIVAAIVLFAAFIARLVGVIQ